MHRSVLLLLVLAYTASVADSLAPVDFTTPKGREHTQMFYAGEIDELWASMTDEMQAALGSVEDLRAFRDQVHESFGEETAVIAESVARYQGYDVYMRRAHFELSEMPINITFSFDSEGAVAGFFIQPRQQAADSPYLDYEPKTELRLPFDGEWYVFWGGRSIEENYHAGVRDQRFALDLLIMRDGRSYSGDGTSLEDYYCWEQAIFAPAPGTVVSAVDGHFDGRPGQLNTVVAPAGNHVILDLGNDEYALLAHLKYESVQVVAGDEVETGDWLGFCGNSGNSSEPHLHFHIQDSPIFGEGDGKPAFFSNYEANGDLVERGEPRRGETISPAD